MADDLKQLDDWADLLAAAREEAKIIGVYAAPASASKTRAPRKTAAKAAKPSKAATKAVTMAAVAAAGAASASAASAARPRNVKTVAAAESVAKELALALNDASETPLEQTLAAAAIPLASMTKSGWRYLVYSHGQVFIWTNELRVSRQGEILFGFRPRPTATHPFIAEREVTLVEVPHTRLATAFPEFAAWVESVMGVSLDDAIAMTAKHVTAGAMRDAEKKPEEPPKPVALEQVIPEWGRWA